MSRPSSGRKLEAAFYYASLGWPVLPLHTLLDDGGCSCQNPQCARPGKHPRTAHGLREATTDPAQIRAWWRQWPDANLGYVMGKQPRLIVVDVDGEETAKE
jgi:Bifunctional DNA primase/polymerase, N-terminal